MTFPQLRSAVQRRRSKPMTWAAVVGSFPFASQVDVEIVRGREIRSHQKPDVVQLVVLRDHPFRPCHTWTGRVVAVVLFLMSHRALLPLSAGSENFR